MPSAADGWEGLRVQIKGRRSSKRPAWPAPRQVKTSQDWDLIMLVLMDESFEPYEIYEADRRAWWRPSTSRGRASGAGAAPCRLPASRPSGAWCEPRERARG